jgi:trans-L-3-hydroxyproline dehydratase
MISDIEIHTLDYHAAGEPLRIVMEGLPAILGDTMADKRRYMAENFDHIRKLLMHEPRGHADMYGAVITVPVSPDADCGVLFMHNEGYSTMCGHGIIALATAAAEHGLFQMADPEAIRIDTPAGLVIARPDRHAPVVRTVTFQNVPAFVQDSGSVSVAEHQVPYTIAFGGAYYAYVEAEALDLELHPENSARIIHLGRLIKEAVAGESTVRHPGGVADLNFLYGVIFTGAGGKSNSLRNVCVFADGELDRSPTGTGVSGRAAILFRQGEIGLNDTLEIESIIGTRFDVRCTEETRVGDIPAVITEVIGSAQQTGAHTFILRDNDPLPEGFFIR